jgi:CDP-glucose 4,6-dehydratase
VIGGGDWSPDRLVPDFVANLLAQRPLVLRNPRAIRPWQHVLEPLSGYLHLAAKLMSASGDAFSEAWNFGPRQQAVLSVLELAQLLCESWQQGEIVLPMQPPPFHEAGMLKLDSTKAQVQLEWSPIWNVQEAVRATVEWYRQYALGGNAAELTHTQLNRYCEQAQSLRVAWMQSPARPLTLSQVI